MYDENNDGSSEEVTEGAVPDGTVEEHSDIDIVEEEHSDIDIVEEVTEEQAPPTDEQFEVAIDFDNDGNIIPLDLDEPTMKVVVSKVNAIISVLNEANHRS